MSKIWKSLLAMKLSCPAYKSGSFDRCKMEVYKALHEQIRFQHRMKMMLDGWRIMESEMPIENDIVIGKIDDVFQSEDGIIVSDYVSSRVPKMYKLFDAALSAAFLRYELETYALAEVVSREGVVTTIPDELIENVWSTVTSEDFQNVLSLSEDELLAFANPASGVCAYCSNEDCKRKRAC